MNYNLITYSIYIPIVVFIMLKVGWLFYKHGEIFLLHVYNHDINIVKSINNILLIGYYLINLGYGILTIAYWEQIFNTAQLISSLTTTLGRIIIALALLHYNNILFLTYIIKSKSLKQ